MYGGYDKYLGISQNGIAEIQISETRDILIRTIEQVNSTMYLSIYTPVNGMRHATIDIYDMDGELVEQIPCTDSYEINEPYNGITNGYVSVDFMNFEFSGNTFVLNTESANDNYAIIILSKEKNVGSASDYARVVQAIQDQTRTLNNFISNQTNDILESIEGQYSGDPTEEFSVNDIVSQHSEKMGVLSFGSDVMLQFLDMFQSANVGTAELTLPGFNITVENVEYSVWPDYSFNFEQLNDWVPSLMSVIRVMLPAFVWLMVLRYCIKVFEDNFLAK